MEILLVLILSLDAFIASIAYGMNKIKIPFISVLVIDIVCTIFLVVSVYLGEFVKHYLPENTTSIISFLILAILGSYYLVESIFESLMEDNVFTKKRIKIKLFDFRLTIDAYIDRIKSAFDDPKKLGPREAICLASALSLDSIAIGFSTGLGSVNLLLVASLSILFHLIAVKCGLTIGIKSVEKTKFNLSWLSGIVLITLGLLKLKIK